MGLSDDENNVEQRFEDLWTDLNTDTDAKDEAWSHFERISHNYTLEGDKLHWLACALYVACRTRVVQTVGRGQMVGNCVSLTRLLRSANLSLVQFFSKMKKWSDMANLPADFRDKVDRLERNFNVSTVIFKKYEPIFLDIFNNPANDPPKQPRGRKQKRLPCTVSDVFSFCWTVFVQVKGNFPAISDDLVNSYHLLLCCVDWFYSNALLSNRKDLLNATFPGLPENYKNKDFKPPGEPPCILQLLCAHHEGLVVEAKGIKEHWFKPYIAKMFNQKALKGKAENLSGVLEIGNFEPNSKAINNQYETFVLSVGDFDERIFLGEEANVEIGTPATSIMPNTSLTESPNRGHLAKRNLESDFGINPLVPSTPLTGRRYLKEKENNVTPVSTATQSVSRLHTLLSGRKTCPSELLIEMFEKCSENPHQEIIQRVSDMGEEFCTNYAKASQDHPGSHLDFAKSRLQLGESLYYKVLEMIVNMEYKKNKDKQNIDFSAWLEQDVFHRSMFACCLEIVIFSYNSQRAFPWIVDVFDLSPYSFYKVIELLIRAEDGLSRDVVKHLNHIEETILESLAWKAESPIWEAIKKTATEIPSCEEVMLPSQIEKEQSLGMNLNTLQQALHPALRRVTALGQQVAMPKNDPQQSPTSAAARFLSPGPGSAKRRLFTNMGTGSAVTISCPSPSSGAETAATSVHKLLAANGQQVFVSIPLKQSCTESPSSAATGPPETPGAQENKPKKTGSLALFFRKLYHLASVRLRDLCERLDVEPSHLSQMWTCFEYCLQNHIELLKDRHLDQILMCAIYVMSKVTGCEKSFQDIMKCYRVQPQAQSHIYRSVLLTSRRRRGSGDSDSSRTGSSRSGTSTPTMVDENKKVERISLMRSSSTLPVPRPNSQPPTPTRLAGTGSSFEFEDRGDIIMFYNTVFTEKVKNFALKFAACNLDKGKEAPPLSPLPMVRPHTCSPRRRVSNHHSLYISPHKQLPSQFMSQRMVYSFDRSPYKDLTKINRMISSEKKTTIKRMRMEELNGDDASKKTRLENGSMAHNRFAMLQSERLVANEHR